MSYMGFLVLVLNEKMEDVKVYLFYEYFGGLCVAYKREGIM
jgi:hypothetical protein